MQEGRLYVASGSSAGAAAAWLAWLWRLGPILDVPDPDALGIATALEAPQVADLVRAGKLAGMVVFAQDPGGEEQALPARRQISGVAMFARDTVVDGKFTVFDGGKAVVRSSLGIHASILDGGKTLVVGADPGTLCTLYHQFWVLEALAAFISSILARPLVLLPAVGCARLDDAPGTAQLQVQGDAISDRRQVSRILELTRAYGRRGAVLNLAVSARALGPDMRTELPLDVVWPRSVAAIAEGIDGGALEPVGHGYLHLDREALDRGEVKKEEFGRLGSLEAGRLIDAAVEWQERVLGRRPGTFVAPSWAYSDGALTALADRRLPAWLRPTLGPLRGPGALHETLDSAFRGMRGLHFGSFVSLADHGLPPTPVFHGRLFDLRVGQLRASRDVLTTLRLALRRDIFRLPELDGIRWVGATELLRLLDAHDSIHVRGGEIDLSSAPTARLFAGKGLAT